MIGAEREKVNVMKLDQMLSKMRNCVACISIKGLCDEYRDGIYDLLEEDWYQESRDRNVKFFSIIGFDEYSFELYIELEN